MLSRLSLLAAALAVGRASAEGLDYCFAEDGPADGLPGCPPAGSAAATKYHELRRAAAAPAEAAEAEPAEPGRQLGGTRYYTVPNSEAAEPAEPGRQLGGTLTRYYTVPNSACPMFADGRVSTPQYNLQNCTLHRPNSCCVQQDVMAAFQELGAHDLVLDGGPDSVCRDVMTYLMCHFCAWDQANWYDAGAAASGGRAVTVCASLCHRVFHYCQGAYFRGQVVGAAFRDGIEFCEAQNFAVMDDGDYRWPTQGARCFGSDSDPEVMPWRFEFRRLTEVEAPGVVAEAVGVIAKSAAALAFPSRALVPIALLATLALGQTTVPTPVAHCPYFNNRAPKPDWGLTNCTWHRPMSCCGVSEEARLVATFEEHLVTGELLGCQQQLNYLLCWPCDAGQQYYYDLERNELSVCRSFCDDLYSACKSAGFKGATLETYVSDGTEFCELLRAKVVSGEDNCLRVFDGGCTAPDWRFLPKTGPWRAGGRGDGPNGAAGLAPCWGLLGIIGLAFALDGSSPTNKGKRKKARKKSLVLLATLAPARAATPDATVLRWAANVGEELRNASRDVLLRDELQDLYDEASYSYTAYNGTEEALKLAERMSKAVKGVEASVAEFKQELLQAYARRDDASVSDDLLPCKGTDTPETANCYYDVDLALPPDIAYSEQYKQKVSGTHWCAKVPDQVTRDRSIKQTIAWTQDRALQDWLTRRFERNQSDWHYFAYGAPDGVIRQHPGSARPRNHAQFPLDYDPRLRPWSLAPTSGPKDVVIVIDTSFSMDEGLSMRRAKRAAKAILKTLTVEDYVAVIEAKSAFRNYWDDYVHSECAELGCVPNKLFPATTSVRVDLSNKIDALEGYGGTGLTEGLQMASDLLRAYEGERAGCQELVVVISDGRRYDAPRDRWMIARGGTTGYWYCCCDDCVPEYVCWCWMPPEKQDYDYDYWHARDLATTMFRDYGQHVFTFGLGVDGTEGHKNGRSPHDRLACLAAAGGGFYQPWIEDDAAPDYEIVEPWLTFVREKTRGRGQVWTSAYIDLTGSGMIASLAEAVYANEGTAEEEFLGVVTSSLSLEQFEKLLLNDIWGTAYAFMIDIEGEAMVHPRLTPPSHLAASPVFPDIESLETYHGEPAAFVDGVRAKMVGQVAGRLAMTARQLRPRGGVLDGVMVVEDEVEYFWAPVPDSQFVVGYSLATPDDVHYRIPLEPPANWAPTAHLTNYLHKLLDYSTLGAAGDAVLQQAFVDLDVRKDGVWNGISYNGIWVTGAKSVITLAERSLCAPEQFTQFDLDDVLVPRAHEMLNELRDDPARPGSCDAGAFLVPRAFADAELGLAIEEPWKNRDMTGPRASFASTGLGTASGVYRFWPGYQLFRGFDPTLRPWYYAAMANKDGLAISTPYVAAGGEGIFVTISATIFEGAPSCADSTALGHDGGCACTSGADCESGVCRVAGGASAATCTSPRVEAVAMGARIYDDFHRRMHALTENACSDDAASDGASAARRCYLVDTAGYAIWAPQFSALNLYDKRSFQSVPLARFEGRVFHELERLGVYTRHTEILYQGTCTNTPAYDMDAVTDEGAFPPAEEVDAHYPGSPTLDYFKPWANTRGCVQDVVYYDLDETAVSGVVTGEVSGACYARAAFSFARAPGTNAYLLVVDDISIGTPPGEKATGFQFSCSVENGLYTPGAYELINGSCGLLHAVPEHPITCPAQTDYLPDASCPSDGAPATRPAFVGLLLAFLAFRIYLY